MRICYLANASDVHTAKWVNHFHRKGHDVEVLSFDHGIGLDPKIVTHALGPRLPGSVHYFLASGLVRRLLGRSKPDIVHAHYASGYGTLARLAGFHPYVLSAWGSDVFEFPEKSFVHRAILRQNLASADALCSTSEFMATRIRRYDRRSVAITPFGVDCAEFRPSEERRDTGEFVIGTVKKLETKYGIEYLLQGFALTAKRYRGKKKLRLVIAGDGALREQLRGLARNLEIDQAVEFLGRIPHERVPRILNTFSVFAALSVADSETFGVAVVEASACGVPVVVTNVGGLPEVVRDRVTGLLVPPMDANGAAAAFGELIENEALRRTLGEAGRRFVLDHYEWSENANRMERVYAPLLRNSLGGSTQASRCSA
jgi:glycosyltransferase involved in cell wall biosynthesis